MTSEHGPRLNPPSPIAVDEVRTHFKYTVSPSVQTLVRLKTLPDAVCRVRFDADDASPFTIISSSAGYIDLYATCAEETESQRIIVEATNTAKAVEQAIDLRCATHPTPDAPNHVPDPWPSSPLDRILPALSDEEAAEEHASALAARGYPKRPDPESARANYQKWRRLVSRPLTVVAPSLIANPDYIHQPRIAARHHQSGTITPGDVQAENWDNWSGGELWFNEGSTFVLVEGWWVTPSVSLNNLPAGYGSTVVWVGLYFPDGPLLQCGVYHNAISYPMNNLVTTYQAFSEMVPAEPHSIMINNLPVAPGDQIMCTSAVVDNNNAPSSRATKTQNHVVNVTKQMSATVAPPLDPAITNGTRHAVWIVERPTLQDKSYPLLAQFPPIKFTNAAAEPANQSLPMMPCYTPNSPDMTTMFDTMTNAAGTVLAVGIEPGNSAPYEVDVIWSGLS